MMFGGVGFIDIQWVETQVSNGVSSDGNDRNTLLLLMDFDLVDTFQQDFGNEQSTLSHPGSHALRSTDSLLWDNRPIGRARLSERCADDSESAGYASLTCLPRYRVFIWIFQISAKFQQSNLNCVCSAL